MEDLLDVNDVAEMLGIKPETVRWYSKHRARREPPFPLPERHYGRAPVWTKQSIADWSASRLQGRSGPRP